MGQQRTRRDDRLDTVIELIYDIPNRTIDMGTVLLSKPEYGSKPLKKFKLNCIDMGIALCHICEVSETFGHNLLY